MAKRVSIDYELVDVPFAVGDRVTFPNGRKATVDEISPITDNPELFSEREMRRGTVFVWAKADDNGTRHVFSNGDELEHLTEEEEHDR